MIESSVKPNEESSVTISGSFKDATGKPITPKTAKWTLKMPDGTEISSGNISLAQTFSFVLSGSDLAVGPSNFQRRLLIEITYDSTAGTGIPLREEISFYIQPLT